MAGPSAIHNGWWNDLINSRLMVYVGGQDVGRFSAPDNGRFEVVGDIKIHKHDMASGYVTEFKAEYTTTGTHSAVDITTQETGIQAAVTHFGLDVTSYTDSTASITGTSYIHAGNFEVTNQGTINGAVIMSAIRATVMASSGTWTSHTWLTPMWLDMKETATLTSGEYYGMVITDNGTTAPTALIYASTGDDAMPFVKIACNNAAMATHSGTPGAVTGATGWIRVDINGNTRYIPLASSVS